jgi:hypothetical protein
MIVSVAMALSAVVQVSEVSASETLQPIGQRFKSADVTETPSFQKHVVPLLGRLGCNGRACHGSFQGQGGFRLSLFGYDFQADHVALHDEESPRVDVNETDESLILVKPTDEEMHEGGQRYKLGSWEHHVLKNWVAGGAKFDKDDVKKLKLLEITPSEVLFQKAGERQQLRVVAVWEDGVREDVTPLCRFKSNDDQIAKVDENGLLIGNKRGDTDLIVSYDRAVVAVPVIRPTTDLVGDRYPAVETPTRIDELVVAKLRKLGVVPSDRAGDAEFLRRVRLDLTGTLPAAEEVTRFLEDKSPDKRARKVDELLETPAYAAWWTTKLCDFTGNSEQNLNNVSPMRNSAPQEWYSWIHRRVKENVPYDELASGIINASSMRDDQTYREYCEEMSAIYRDDDKSFADLPSMTYYWSRRDFQNDIEARAIGFAYSFMGLRIQCAQCHKHPFDQWSKDDFHQFKNFFSRIVAGRANAAPREHRAEYNKLVAELGLKGKRGNELRKLLPDLLEEGKAIPFPVMSISKTIQRSRDPGGDFPKFETAKFLGGESFQVEDLEDPRTELMTWLRSPDNPFFAKAFVNRVWASYFNVGIVEPADDLSLGNPPSNKALLDYLAKGFIESGFDMKWVHRTIANSRTYQSTWRANDTNQLDERNFSRAVPRRLPAEVAYDAIQQATSSDSRVAELLASNDGRAIAIPGAGRRSGSADQRFILAVFGRSTRESNCDCDRSSEPTLLQTVLLQNDDAMLRMIGIQKDSWLQDVAKELGSKKQGPASPQKTRQIASTKRQITTVKARLRKLRKTENTKQIEAAEKRLAALQRQLRKLQPAEPTKVERVEIDAAGQDKIAKLITQAYLRTLGRYPDEREMGRSQQHVRESDDPVDGLRDVLWALLNTKEFIVNH